MAALAATMHAAALTLLLISSAHAVPDVAAPPTVAPGPIVRGAALNGLLALEDWFFSWHEGLPAVVPFPFDEVASPPTLPQGRSFPSHKLSSDLIDPWLSEGALIGKSAVRNGANTTVDALTAHRESYITEYDFAQMASVGVEHVRLAVGWWVFASDPLPARAGLLPDPCYPDLQFVTVSAGMLETILKQGQRHGVKFLIDMHAMPCGSSDGTYNGVFPRNPQFFSNTTAKAIGLGVIRNMLSWYKDLPADLQSTVWAFTLLNEPGLGVVNGGDGTGGSHVRPGNTALPNNKPVLAWLGEAVQVFKQELSALIASKSAVMPLLYMNLHESAFPGGDALNQMGKACSEWGLGGQPWAVLDVHHYFSWGGPDGSGIPARNCSTDAELQSFVSSGMDHFTRTLKTVAVTYDIINVACSEWALSLHHKDHILPCTAPNALKIMYDEQISGFQRAGVSNFFWGWKMPQGGTHEPMWSLKLHLLGQH